MKANLGRNDRRGDRLHPSRFSRLYWHLVALRRIYQQFAQQYVTEFSNGVLLDYGCGNSPYRPLLEPLLHEYLGADLVGNDLADLHFEADGVLPIEDHSVHFVLSSQVLEHVVDPAHYLQESRRVLKSDGLLLLSTHGVWKYHPDPTDFWRWTSAGLKRLIEQEDFEIVDFAGIMGPIATSIQLFQDATQHLCPRMIRPLFFATCQIAMQLGDWMTDSQTISSDACVYFVVARKRPS